MKALLIWFSPLLCVTALPAHAAEDAIRLEAVAGTRIKRGIVQGTIDAPAERIWQVITDYEHYTEFMPRTEKAEVRNRTEQKVTYYSYLGMPWPIEDVAYVCEATMAPDHRSVDFRMIPGSGQGVKQFNGSWKLEPTGERTVVIYTLFFEPQRGYAPWLFDLGTKHSLARVIEAVRKRVARFHAP